MISTGFIRVAASRSPVGVPAPAERIECESLKLANYDRVAAFLRSQGLEPDKGLIALRAAAEREIDAAKGQTLLPL